MMKAGYAMAAVWLLVWAAAGCGDEGAAAADDCGDGGVAVSHEGVGYCSFAKPITETGFDCPAALPFSHPLGDRVVCGPGAELARDDLEAIVTAAGGMWSLEPWPRQVGVEARFVTCEQTEQTEAYCAAETLSWTLDSASKRLRFDNRRALLNCCGVRSIEAWQTGPTSYELRQRDAPEATDMPGLTGRCNCQCSFDFAVAIDDVTASAITVTMSRATTDAVDTSPQELYRGELDLSAGEGELLIDDSDATGFCGTLN